MVILVFSNCKYCIHLRLVYKNKLNLTTNFLAVLTEFEGPGVAPKTNICHLFSCDTSKFMKISKYFFFESVGNKMN